MDRRMMLITGGVVIVALLVIGAGVFLFLPSLTSGSQAATSGASSTPTAASTPKAKNPFAAPLKQYGPDIRNQIAQGLHLTADQVAAEIKSGKTIMDIANEQKVTTDQLNTIVANAFNNGLQPAVQAGNLTQKQVDNLVKRMQKNPKALDNFLKAGMGKGKKGDATPTATTATPTN